MFGLETGTVIIIGIATLAGLGVGITGTARILTGKKKPDSDD